MDTTSRFPARWHKPVLALGSGPQIRRWIDSRCPIPEAATFTNSYQTKSQSRQAGPSTFSLQDFTGLWFTTMGLIPAISGQICCFRFRSPLPSTILETAYTED